MERNKKFQFYTARCRARFVRHSSGKCVSLKGAPPGGWPLNLLCKYTKAVHEAITNFKLATGNGYDGIVNIVEYMCGVLLLDMHAYVKTVVTSICCAYLFTHGSVN